MNKDIQPAITLLNLGHMIKLLKTFGVSREDTNRQGVLDLNRRTMVVLTGLLVTLTMAGCTSAPKRVLFEKAPTYAALPNGYNPLSPDQVSPMYAEAAFGANENLARNLERKRGHALNILSMSGGGQNGA
ncbi:hypothetical protein BMR02_16010, partial [Methylococcaceae bacterium HT1]